ncbi:hypothetical protein GGF31_006149 [Allomyces arbusculus]|nr:hypothetical protein GGF31_006149 [Allomyces arbusculus]
MNEVVKVVRASPDAKLTVFDAVVIDSWNGDTYGGIDLELVVSKFGASVSMLVFPGYSLCAKPSLVVVGWPDMAVRVGD